MAITAKLYGNFPLQALKKEHDLPNDTIKVAATTSAHTPDQDAHDYFDDLTNEISGTGYTAGGWTLASKTLTYTAGTNVIKFDAADINEDPADFTLRNLHVYNDTPAADADKGLIGFQQSDSDITVSGGAFDIVWDADGVAEITVS